MCKISVDEYEYMDVYVYTYAYYVYYIIYTRSMYNICKLIYILKYTSCTCECIYLHVDIYSICMYIQIYVHTVCKCIMHVLHMYIMYT